MEVDQPEMEAGQPEMEAVEELAPLFPEVLGNGDLLDEILLRLDSPAYVILACKTNKFWRNRRRHPKFVTRFLDRLALRARPLGFYVVFESSPPRSKFVPMPQSPVLADIVNGGDPGEQSLVLDCRNGTVLLNLHRGDDGTYAVLRPLDEPSVFSLLPKLPHTMDGNKSVWHLPDDCWDGTSVLVMDMSSVFRIASPTVQLSLLRYDAWSTEIFNATGLAAGGHRVDNRLQHRNVYMLSSTGYILQLEFSHLNPMTMRFLTIELPAGVDFVPMFNDQIFDKHILSRGHGSSVYFIQLRGSDLSVWVTKVAHDAANMWLLDAVISLPQVFGNLAGLIGQDEVNSDQNVQPDNVDYDVLRLFTAGDYADSVFLVDGTNDYHHIFFLNIRTKTVEVAYSRLPGDPGVRDIHPFLVV